MQPSKHTFGGAKEPADNGALANALGRFILNFGALEFQSYVWLSAIMPGGLSALVGEMSLADRMNRIRKEIKSRTMPRSLRDEMTDAWDEVRRLSELRNIVAHGPLIWRVDENGLFEGFVPSVKKSLQGKPATAVRAAELSDAVARSGAVYNRLEDLRKILTEDGTESEGKDSSQ